MQAELAYKGRFRPDPTKKQFNDKRPTRSEIADTIPNYLGRGGYHNMHKSEERKQYLIRRKVTEIKEIATETIKPNDFKRVANFIYLLSCRKYKG